MPRKKEFKTEPIWTFMGGLACEEAKQMRRVMAAIHLAYNPTKPPPKTPRYNLRVLDPAQREPIEARIQAMRAEAEGKELLTEMMKWFGRHWGADKDEEIVVAAKGFRDHVSWFVRNPTLYKVELEREKERWGEFTAEWPRNNGFVEARPSDHAYGKTTKKSKQIVILAKSVSEDEEVEEEFAVKDDSGSEYEP